MTGEGTDMSRDTEKRWDMRTLPGKRRGPGREVGQPFPLLETLPGPRVGLGE